MCKKYAFSDIIFVAHILITFFQNIVISVQIAPFDKELTLGDNVRSFLDNFGTCHFKLFLVNKTLLYNERFSASFSFINFLNDKATFSLDTLDSYNGSQYLSPERNHHKSRRLSACFIHFYQIDHLVPEKGFQGQRIVFKMNQSESAGEKPNFFMFFVEKPLASEQPLASRKEFYSKSLPKTIVNGLTFEFGLTTDVYMVCISCPVKQLIRDSFSVLTPIKDESHLKNLDELRKIYFKIYSDLHGVFLDANVHNFTEEDLSVCENLRGAPDKNRKFVHPHVCINHVLSNALNYSFVNNTNDTIFTHGEVASRFYISEENYQEILAERVGRREYLVHAIRYLKFYFTAVQLKPAFQAGTLLQPFDLVTWMLIAVTGVLLFAVTLLRARFSSEEFHDYLTSKLLLTVFATTVDQPTPDQFRGSEVYQSSSLGTSWLLWFMMLCILGNFYKGEIFSFLTHFTPPHWPRSLGELVNDASYFLVTFATAVDGNERFSVFKHEYLHQDLSSTTGTKSARRWQRKLLESLLWYPEGHKLFAYQVAASSLDFSPNSTVFNETVSTNHQFAIIDYEHVVDYMTLSFSMFTPNYVMSKAKVVPGYVLIVPWSMTNTYLRPLISRALGKCFESGIYDRLTQRLEGLRNKLNFDSFGGLLQQHFPHSLEYRIKSNRYYSLALALRNGGNGNKGPEVDSATPLSLTMLNSLFLLCGLLVVIAATIFVAEVVTKIRFRKRRYRSSIRVSSENDDLKFYP